MERSIQPDQSSIARRAEADGLETERRAIRSAVRGLTKGDRVLHAQYGTGTLTDVNEYHAVSDFDEHGARKFITNLAAIEATRVPAPERPAKAVRRGGARTRPRN